MIEARFQLQRLGFSLDAALAIERNEVTALFGRSGSGKTTLLRCIAGLERAPRGRLIVDGETWQDEGAWLPTHRRQLGYVFQDADLFPHLTVMGNLRYGMNRSSGAPAIHLDEVVELLGIGHLLQRRPAKLSGGERQRVAIGRTLLASPRLLLMDEPLASLDMDKKHEILPLIERLRDDLRLPILYVSHAADEVARLADRVLRIEAGRIVSEGSAATVLGRRLETTRFSRISVLTARVSTFDEAFGLTMLQHPAGSIGVAARFEPNQRVRVVIHAIDVTLALSYHDDLSVRTSLEGKVDRIESDGGPTATVMVQLDGGESLAVSATRKAIASMRLVRGLPVWCLIKTVSIDERWLRSH